LPSEQSNLPFACEKTAAVLRFAAKAARDHGRVSESDIAAVREAGYTEAELVEIVAYISLSMFRAYFNLMTRTAIDFPIVKSADPAHSQSSGA
jgi:alkylhydroperoxidase family enzyme